MEEGEVVMEAMIEATTMTITEMVKAVIADITLRTMDTTKAAAPAIEAGAEVVAETTLASDTTTETTIIGSATTDKVVTMVVIRVIIITAIMVAAITSEGAQPRQTSQTTTKTLTANRWASSRKGGG